MTAIFLYGTLKPGQIAFHKIAALVERSQEAALEGYELVVRDCLPYIRPQNSKERVNRISGADGGRPVKGFVVFGNEELLSAVDSHEGDELYLRENVTAITDTAERIIAIAFVQRKARNRPTFLIESGQWQVADDSMLAFGFPRLSLKASQYNDIEPCPADSIERYWEGMWQLQGIYANLCSVVERLTLFLFGASANPTSRIVKLNEDRSIFALVQQLDLPVVRVYDAKDVDNSKQLSTETDPFLTWYQVRSNLFHQGKSEGFADFKIMKDSVFGLSRALGVVIGKTVPDISQRWFKQGFQLAADGEILQNIG